MNISWGSLLAACTAALFCGSALAIAAEPNTGQNQAAIQDSPGIIQISTLMGTTVLDPQNKKLGRIKDVLLDSKTGQATFVVLDAAASGAGHAMLVVPYQALRTDFNPSDDRRSLVLDLRADRVRTAPQIKDNQWQMLQNPQFLEQARNFYQARTYTAARPIESPPSLPAMLPPCVNSVDSGSGLPQDLVDFYNE
jgi:hypothetical protein